MVCSSHSCSCCFSEHSLKCAIPRVGEPLSSKLVIFSGFTIISLYLILYTVIYDQMTINVKEICESHSCMQMAAVSANAL